MADSFHDVTDLVKINDLNALDLGINDLFDDAPLIKVLAAVPASNGTEHKYLKETTGPTVGFRAENTGRENSKSADTLITETLKILDASMSVDKAIADAYHKGPQTWLAREAKRHLKAALFKMEKQVIYGTTTGGDSGGFTGFMNNAALDALADDRTIDAGGTTANTASSVYLIRSNDVDGVASVFGNDGVIKMDEAIVQAIEDTTNGGRFTAYHVPILGYAGLQYGSINSVVRICNLTEDSGKGLTDTLLAKALEQFPAGRQPNRIAMNRRSLRQLQASRTATNATGAPAPRPTEYEGIQIVVTDAILNTEALET